MYALKRLMLGVGLLALSAGAAEVAAATAATDDFDPHTIAF